MQALHLRAAVGGAVLALAAGGVHAPAQIAFDPAAPARPLVLSISGASSKGVYQAGVNWSVLELFRHAAWDTSFHTVRPGRELPVYRVEAISGASAGNVNTVLWAIEACTNWMRSGANVDAAGRYVSPDPESSLFWQTWGTLSLQNLLRARGGEPGLFDRSAVLATAGQEIRRRQALSSLEPGCEVPIGITLTGLVPDLMDYHGLEIETQRFATALRARVSGPAPRLDFYPMSLTNPHAGAVVQLGADTAHALPIDTVLQAVQASAAFPYAFAPVPLVVWRNGGQGQPAHEWFTDGGLFDNNPVGLAKDIFLRDQSGHTDIVYVRPLQFRDSLERARRSLRPAPPHGGLAAVVTTFQHAARSGRQYELQMVQRDEALHDTIQALRNTIAGSGSIEENLARVGERDSLLITTRGFPIFGEFLGDFAAFGGLPLRRFDYDLGIYDGLVFGAQAYVCGRADRACVREQVRAWITDPHVTGAPMRPVMAMMFDHEFPPQSPADSLSRVVRPAIDSAGVADRVAVMRTLQRALASHYAPPDPTRRAECRSAAAVHLYLCRGGFRMVLDSIRADTQALRILQGWARSPRCTAATGGIVHLRSARRVPAPAGPCEAEPDFVRWVENPRDSFDRLFDRLLVRAQEVEETMRAASVLPRPGDAAAGAAQPAKRDYYTAARAMSILFRMSPGRRRKRWELHPSAAYCCREQFAPMTVSVNPGAKGQSIEWLRPTFNPKTRLSIGVPIGLYVSGAAPTFPNSPALKPTAHFFATIGVAATHRQTAWLSGGATYTWMRPVSDVLATTRANRVDEVEAHLETLYGLLRVGYRVTPHIDFYKNARRDFGGTWSIGINDIPAILQLTRQFMAK